MRYVEIINEIEVGGGGVDSNILEPFPKFDPKEAEPRQLELFKEFPPLTTDDVTTAGYKPLGRIGKYAIAEMVKNFDEDARTFVLFDEEKNSMGVVYLSEPTSMDGNGSGYRPAQGIHYVVHGKGYRVSTVYIDDKHSGQNLAIRTYYFLLLHVCDWLMADTVQTGGGVAIWRKMLNSNKFCVLVYDNKRVLIRRRWRGKDFQQVYNAFHLHPIVTLPSKENFILTDPDNLDESIRHT